MADAEGAAPQEGAAKDLRKQLEELRELTNAELISEEEFAETKKKLLAAWVEGKTGAQNRGPHLQATPDRGQGGMYERGDTAARETQQAMLDAMRRAHVTSEDGNGGH